MTSMPTMIARAGAGRAPVPQRAHPLLGQPSSLRVTRPATGSSPWRRRSRRTARESSAAAPAVPPSPARPGGRPRRGAGPCGPRGGRGRCGRAGRPCRSRRPRTRPSRGPVPARRGGVEGGQGRRSATAKTREGTGSILEAGALDRRLDGVAGFRRPGPVARAPLVQGELHAEGAGRRVRVDQRVRPLVRLARVVEPQPHPHRGWTPVAASMPPSHSAAASGSPASRPPRPSR